MIVRFGYTSADADGNSFALQPRARPMPGFGATRRGQRVRLAGFGDDTTGDTSGSTDVYDPGQAAWGGTGSTPDTSGTTAVLGPPNPDGTPAGTTYADPTRYTVVSPSAAGGGGSPTLASIFGFINGVIPKQAAAVPVKSTSSIVLPIILAAGGLGLVALLISSRKK